MLGKLAAAMDCRPCSSHPVQYDALARSGNSWSSTSCALLMISVPPFARCDPAHDQHMDMKQGVVGHGIPEIDADGFKIFRWRGCHLLTTLGQP